MSGDFTFTTRFNFCSLSVLTAFFGQQICASIGNGTSIPNCMALKLVGSVTTLKPEFLLCRHDWFAFVFPH
jgi:hypothetical protein